MNKIHAMEEKRSADTPVRKSGERSVAESGQECPHSVFLDLSQPIAQYRHVLPHWEQAGKWVFVTWRLKDSLPAEKLREWREEKTRWLEEHPDPWDEQTDEDYHRTFSDQINYWLDKGSGTCVLRDPAIGKQVVEVLLYDDGKRIEMDCFVVMPNHVHALFRLLPGASLETVIKSWKGISARRINQQLGQSGTLWQEDYWDRLIRSEKHFHRVRRYIRENPQDAGLREGYFLWERGHSCPPASD